MTKFKQAKTFSDLFRIKYGERGTEKREEFEVKAEVFYLKEMIKTNKQFENHKDELLSLILELEYSKLESWVFKMKAQKFSKQSIYEILCELHLFLQYYSKTKDEDIYYDFLSDFLDRFTVWGKASRTLPNEPDCK